MGLPFGQASSMAPVKWWSPPSTVTLGPAFAMTEGEVHGVGDIDIEFTIQSISKAIRSSMRWPSTRRGSVDQRAGKASGVRTRSRIQAPAGFSEEVPAHGPFLSQVPVLKTAPERWSSEKFQFTQLIFLLAMRSR